MRSADWLADGYLAGAVERLGWYDVADFDMCITRLAELENSWGIPPEPTRDLDAQHPWPWFPEDAYRRRVLTSLSLDKGVPAAVVDLATSVQYLRRWAEWCDAYADTADLASMAKRFRAAAERLRIRAEENDTLLDKLPSDWATEGDRGGGQPQHFRPIRLRTA